MPSKINLVIVNLGVILISAQISCNSNMKNGLAPENTNSIQESTIPTQSITQNINRDIIPQTTSDLKLYSNYAVMFLNIPCGKNPEWILDTSNRTLRYQPIGDEHIIERKFDLGQVDKEIINEYAIEIGFYEYPNEYKADKLTCFSTPHQYYELTIINGEKRNKVVWIDETQMCDNNEKSNQLRKIIHIIKSFIIEYAFYLHLPQPSALCL